MSNEKVKILKDQGGRYLLPSNSIVFTTPFTKGTGSVIRTVNGIELPNLSYNVRVIQIPKPSDIVIIKKSQERVAYQDKDGKVLFNDEYQKQLTEYTNKGEYYDYEWKFDNIDDEYSYKKFIQAYTPIYEEVVDEMVFTNFDIIETIVSEYEEITPVESVVLNPDEMLFLFRPSRHIILSEVAERLGYNFIEDKEYGRLRESEKLKTITVSTHSGYDYTKINGNYINDEERRQFNKIREFRGSYVECIKEKEKYVDLAYGILKPYADRLNQRKLTSTNVGDMITFLSNIKNRIYNLDVKKVDVNTHRTILSNIQTKIDELTNL